VYLPVIDAAGVRLQPTPFTPWLDLQTIRVASDPTIPNPPTLEAHPATHAIRLVLKKPETNTDGTPYRDHAWFEVFYGTSSGINPEDPSTYTGSFTTPATEHTFAASVTHYFVAIACDRYGNKSAPSDEVSATPKTS